MNPLEYKLATGTHKVFFIEWIIPLEEAAEAKDSVQDLISSYGDGEIVQEITISDEAHAKQVLQSHIVK